MEFDVDIRRWSAGDLDFLTRIDLEDEGVTNLVPGRERFGLHRRRISEMLAGDASAWIVEAKGVSRPAGAIVCRFRDLASEAPDEANLYLLRYLPRNIFPADGRFVEIYQL